MGLFLLILHASKVLYDWNQVSEFYGKEIKGSQYKVKLEFYKK